MKDQIMSALDFPITDQILFNSKIVGYNFNSTVKNKKGEDVPVNPKKFPGKAILIIYKDENVKLKIYLDQEFAKWDGEVYENGEINRLTPEQFTQFFDSKFYRKLQEYTRKIWPESDIKFKKLLVGVNEKRVVSGKELRKSDIQSINLKQIVDEISEDMIAPTGATTCGDVMPSSSSSSSSGEITSIDNSTAGIKRDDVLGGGIDHQKYGYMGSKPKDNFEIPSNVLSGQILRRKLKKSKNPYIKR